MRYILHYLIISIIFLGCYNLFGQRSDEHPSPFELFTPTLHDAGLAKVNEVSFYQQKDRWQEIIDSTWGPGLELDQKIEIFTTYTKALDDNYPCFPNLHFDWDSLKSYFYNQIDSTTSRGRFAAIMGHLSYSLKDLHTRARDNDVAYTPLNPGTPLVILGGVNDIRHFGAVLTVLEDSSIVVLKAAENHPLNLEPGDEILGYEGVSWLTIIDELLESEVPIAGHWAGAESANFDAKMICAGMNWHLFKTIDVLKFSSGQVQSLPTSSMLTLDIQTDWMFNNEQLDLPNISFPDYHYWGNEYEGSTVSYGVLEGSNIGFIYLTAEEWDVNLSDNEFYEAVNALRNTEGLIIDLRYNFGGWALFDDAFDILFNSHIYTLDEVVRCSPSNFSLCVDGWQDAYDIPAGPNDFYERPIAVLTGPSCVSMGDVTNYRLKYHPNVRLFGKSSNASMSTSKLIEEFDGWHLRYGTSDIFRLEEPDFYLNQKELPIDYPVWFNKTDIANGYDTVLEEAKQYVSILTHCFDARISSTYVTEEVSFSASLNYKIWGYPTITAHIKNENEVVDSFYCPILHNPRDVSYIGKTRSISKFPEDFYSISITTKTNTPDHVLPDILRFTNAGPLKVKSYEAVQINELNKIRVTALTLINESENVTIPDVRVKLTCEDPSVTNISYEQSFGDISPQETFSALQSFYIDVDVIKNYTFSVEISSREVVYWKDEINFVDPSNIKEGEWVVYNVSNSEMPGIPSSNIVIDRNNNKWFVSGNKLIKYNGNDWTQIPLTGNDYLGIRLGVDNLDRIYVGHSNGLEIFDGIEWSTHIKSFEHFNGMAIDSDNVLWIAAHTGLHKFDGNNLGTPILNLYSNHLSSIAIDKNNNKWLGTPTDGLLMFDGNYWTQHPTDLQGLDDIVIDNENNKWINAGRFKKQIALFDGSEWTILDSTNSKFSNQHISCMEKDSSGNIWIVLERSRFRGGLYGIASFDGLSWKIYTPSDIGSTVSIGDIAIDSLGNKWLVSRDGIIVFNENNIVTAVDSKSEEGIIPEKHYLSQNYPNPFNPSTTIKYTIPTSEFGIQNSELVSLRIYDILGREVATLVNENQRPGNYKVEFDGTELSSGIYLYKLTAGNFNHVNKMMLLK